MNNEAKRRVAWALLSSAGDLVERWEQLHADAGMELPCTSAEAAELIGRWLQRLPGDAWDTRLGDG